MIKHLATYFVTFSVGYWACSKGTPYWNIFIALPLIALFDWGIGLFWSKVLKQKNINYL